MTRVSFQPDQDLKDFMLDELGLDLEPYNLEAENWFTVTVRNDHGAVIAGLVCEAENKFEMRFTAAIADEKAITNKLLSTIFGSLFLRVARLSALVDPDNAESIDRLERLGFVYEGFLRRGLDGVNDAMLYGMLPEDCKFLPGVRATRALSGGPDGIATQAT